MGGIFQGARPIPTGSAAAPGLPFADSPLNGIFKPTDTGGIGLALSGLEYFNLGPNSFALGKKPALTGFGTISALSTLPAGNAQPYQGCVSPEGNHVYTANALSSVALFSRDTTSGQLTYTASYSAGSYPYGCAISPLGDHVYVSDYANKNIQPFSRNRSTGALTVIGAPVSTGAQAAQNLFVTPDGLHVIVVITGGSLRVYARSLTAGTIAEVGGSPFAVGGAANDLHGTPDGKFILVSCDDDKIAVLSRNATTGALTSITGSPFSTGSNQGAKSVTVSPDGLSVYVPVSNSGVPQVNGYSINSISGQLIALAGSPYALGTMVNPPSQVSVSPNNLRVCVGGSDRICILTRNASSGVLSAPVNYNTDATAVVAEVIFSPDNFSLYAAVINSSNFYGWKLASSKTLSPIDIYFDPSGSNGSLINFKAQLLLQQSPVQSQATADARYVILSGALGAPASGDLSACTTNTEAANNNSTQLASTAYADRLTGGTLPVSATTLSASGAGVNTKQFSLTGAGTSFELRGMSGNGSTQNSMIYRLNLDYLDGAAVNSYIDFYRGLGGGDGYLKLGASGADVATISSTGLAVTGTISATSSIRAGGFIVSTLPAGTTGDETYVTDAIAPTYLGALTGGGAVVCPVIKNATVWVSH